MVAAYSTPQLEVFQVVEGSAHDSSTGILHSLGLISRSMPDRAASVSFSPCGKLLACLGAGKVVELFRSDSSTCDACEYHSSALAFDVQRSAGIAFVADRRGFSPAQLNVVEASQQMKLGW